MSQVHPDGALRPGDIYQYFRPVHLGCAYGPKSSAYKTKDAALGLTVAKLYMVHHIQYVIDKIYMDDADHARSLSSYSCWSRFVGS